MPRAARSNLIRIFADADVLIAAARGSNLERDQALALLADPGLEFVYDPFLRLEVLLQPTYNGRVLEIQFYQEYFRTAEQFGMLDRIFDLGQQECFKHGIKVMDAMHIAAARLAGCDALITLERSTSPMYRTQTVPVRRLL